MGTTAEKLNKLLNTKQAIKQAIIDKGVDVSDDTVFADYPSKIESIVSEGVDPYYEYLWIRSTNNNTNYSYLFCRYTGKELDVSKLDTSNVTNMNNMFDYCNRLTSLDVSNFDTSKVIDMKSMFNGCSDLTSLDLSNFDTSNVTDMSNMFYNCKDLTSLDVSNFDTSNVTNMSYMFSNCNALTSLDVSNFDTSKASGFSMMFYDCKSLSSLDLSSWDIIKATASYNLSNFFYRCTGLVDFKAPKNINGDISFSDCINLSHDSLMRIINNLMTTTSTKTLELGGINLAKLSDEEKAIATNKGWTLK